MRAAAGPRAGPGLASAAPALLAAPKAPASWRSRLVGLAACRDRAGAAAPAAPAAGGKALFHLWLATGHLHEGACLSLRADQLDKVHGSLPVDFSIEIDYELLDQQAWQLQQGQQAAAAAATVNGEQQRR